MVSDDLCDPQLQPAVSRSCATDACSPEWFIDQWTNCTSDCLDGVQFRTVFCQQVIAGSLPSVIDNQRCVEAIGPKPSSMQKCNQD